MSAVRMPGKPKMEVRDEGVQSDLCWFCGRNPAKAVPVAVQMTQYSSAETTVHVGGSRTEKRNVKWQWLSFPRCERCRQVHRAEVNFRVRMTVLLVFGIPTLIAVFHIITDPTVTQRTSVWLAIVGTLVPTSPR